MLSVHILYAYVVENVNIVTKCKLICNICQAFSFKMTLQKSNNHKESLHSANCTMSLKLVATKKIAKMKESLY